MITLIQDCHKQMNAFGIKLTLSMNQGIEVPIE